MAVRERIGAAIGAVLAPAIAVVSRFRRARTFHPRGQTFIGRCEPIIGSAAGHGGSAAGHGGSAAGHGGSAAGHGGGAFANIGADLAGEVLARCSGALWKHPHERFDVLGIALRFRNQDLLFATIKSPFTMVFAPFTTNAHDYLANYFYTVAPFEVPNHDRVELRLVPQDPPALMGSRDDKLLAAVEAGRCVWHLEARRTLTRDWHAVARISLDETATVDQEALHFDAFRTDGKLQPVGVVHAMRKAVYAASQAARPAHA